MESTWDVIAVSAMDKDQKAAFERQLHQIRQQSDYVARVAVNFRVYADEPEGVKIGGGGATLSILHRLYSEFDSRLFTFRILLIHAGGYSQRQPNASVLGKLFISTPIKNTEDPHGLPLTLFELKLRSYQTLLNRMKPGLFLASSDTLEYLGDADVLDSAQWSLDGPGLVALAHPSSLDIGQQHGVYVIDEKSGLNKLDVLEMQCRRVLQKPSIGAMRAEGAVQMGPDGKGEFVYTDSAYYISPNVIQSMLNIYDRLAPLKVELDAYGDFLQPLGSHATDDYLRGKAVNAMVHNDQLVSDRRFLFDSLRNFELKLLIFNKSTFYHLGTFHELIKYFCGDDEKFRMDFGAGTSVFSTVTGSNSDCVICSEIGGKLITAGSSKCIIEYCKFLNGLEFGVDGGRCILSHCSTGEHRSVRIPAAVFLMTMPITDGKAVEYVTVVFGIDDDLKRIVQLEKIPSPEFSAVNIALKMWENGINVFDDQFPRSLWYARMFPTFDDSKLSFDWTLRLLNAVCDGKNETIAILQDGMGTSRHSMYDVVCKKNIDALFAYRRSLMESIGGELEKGGKI